ncbi:MAG TPA: PD-(D/E)XK nuclease family protein [Actinomycetes bacterium]|nr:PD-(D/E)XK nuclease family protein [Actinomycetes bacterium]
MSRRSGATSSSSTALSPSRAGDFMTCPLLYRFRVIDRLPEPPSPAAIRGTVVHTVLERLFDRPARERTLGAATDLLPAAWAALLESDPDLAQVFSDDPDSRLAAEWLAGSEDLLATYFTLEDPTRLEPAERELYVEVTLESGLTLRGYVDRLDVAPDGAMRVVDYKTGKSPRDGFEQRAMFQMRFYALALWRLHGEVPRLLQLVYLGDGEVVRYAPDEADLQRMERKLEALWQAIQRAQDTGDWRPSPSRLCDWCAHRSLCPAWGGTPPALPAGPGPTAAGSDELPSPHMSPIDI